MPNLNGWLKRLKIVQFINNNFIDTQMKGIGNILEKVVGEGARWLDVFEFEGNKGAGVALFVKLFKIDLEDLELILQNWKMPESCMKTQRRQPPNLVLWPAEASEADSIFLFCSKRLTKLFTAP